MADLTPAEMNLLAWHTLPCDYVPCSQPIGRRCITASGARTSPHALRLRALDWWLAGVASRDAEVAELMRNMATAQEALTNLTTERAKLKTDLAEAATNAGLLTDQLKTARLGAALVPGLQQQVADLLAKIAVLEHPVADVVLYANPTTQRILLPAGKRGGGAGANGAFRLVRG